MLLTVRQMFNEHSALNSHEKGNKKKDVQKCLFCQFLFPACSLSCGWHAVLSVV